MAWTDIDRWRKYRRVRNGNPVIGASGMGGEVVYPVRTRNHLCNFVKAITCLRLSGGYTDMMCTRILYKNSTWMGEKTRVNDSSQMIFCTLIPGQFLVCLGFSPCVRVQNMWKHACGICGSIDAYMMS